MRPQFLELAIFRSEIVAPFADAMRLVDGELRYVPVRASTVPARRKAYGTRRDAGRASGPWLRADPALNSSKSPRSRWFAVHPPDLSSAK
jgi:hypothetical protein